MQIIDSYMQLIMWLKPGEVFSLSCQVGVAWRFKSYEEWFYDKVSNHYKLLIILLQVKDMHLFLYLNVYICLTG